MLDRVSSVIHSHNLLHQNDRIIIAVSGGADSMALLHILADIVLPLELIAVYIDHGLRPRETPLEQEIIADRCGTLDIIFQVRAVNVQQIIAQKKKSPEEAARFLRYKALEEVRQQYDARYIAVAHTADDQVEEFFIRLLRGSSRRGLSGMRLRRDAIIRPLLFETKADIMTFLTDRGLSWCFDSSNLDRSFLRNRVRLDLLPLLEKDFNPAVRKTITQSMDILAQEDDLLEELALSAYGQCVEWLEATIHEERRPQLIIKRQELLTQHPAIQRRIMEKSCWQMGIRPSYTQIHTLVESLASGKNSTEIHLEDGVRVEKSAQRLHFTRPLPGNLRRGAVPSRGITSQSIPGPGTYTVQGTEKQLVIAELPASSAPLTPGELRLDAAGLSFPLQLRSCQPGEKFHPYGAPGRKKISRYFNEQKIPAKERAAWPVLLSGSRVIALVGLQIDHSLRISSSTRRIFSLIWQDRQN